MHHRKAFTILLLSIALGPTQVPMAENAEPETWQMATKGANIQEFVAQVARITGKTFIVDPKLKGQVTVISDTPLGKDGVYALFLSVLRLQNYTAVPSGDVIRIQQSATGKQTPGALGRPEAAADVAQDATMRHWSAQRSWATTSRFVASKPCSSSCRSAAQAAPAFASTAA